MSTASSRNDAFADDVRLFVFHQAAATGHVPQPPQISAALGVPEADVRSALQVLAAGRVLILAPNDGDIWAANPFCAVPSGIRVNAGGRRYWAICIWDALGIAAALAVDAVITVPCGDWGAPMVLEVRDGRVAREEGIVHFAVPARHWWDNIGFT
ncbi:hypothetical protein BH23GEM2_BH23GEM2_16430 [soil metagenome]